MIIIINYIRFITIFILCTMIYISIILCINSPSSCTIINYYENQKNKIKQNLNSHPMCYNTYIHLQFFCMKPLAHCKNSLNKISISTEEKQ